MEMITFTLVAIALYVVSDRLLNMLEQYLGRRLPQRSLIFFAILLVLSLTAFSLIRGYFAA